MGSLSGSGLTALVWPGVASPDGRSSIGRGPEAQRSRGAPRAGAAGARSSVQTRPWTERVSTRTRPSSLEHDRGRRSRRSHRCGAGSAGTPGRRGLRARRPHRRRSAVGGWSTTWPRSARGRPSVDLSLGRGDAAAPDEGVLRWPTPRTGLRAPWRPWCPLAADDARATRWIGDNASVTVSSGGPRGARECSVSEVCVGLGAGRTQSAGRDADGPTSALSVLRSPGIRKGRSSDTQLHTTPNSRGPPGAAVRGSARRASQRSPRAWLWRARRRRLPTRRRRGHGQRPGESGARLRRGLGRVRRAPQRCSRPCRTRRPAGTSTPATARRAATGRCTSSTPTSAPQPRAKGLGRRARSRRRHPRPTRSAAPPTLTGLAEDALRTDELANIRGGAALLAADAAAARAADGRRPPTRGSGTPRSPTPPARPQEDVAAAFADDAFAVIASGRLAAHRRRQGRLARRRRAVTPAGAQLDRLGLLKKAEQRPGRLPARARLRVDPRALPGPRRRRLRQPRPREPPAVARRSPTSSSTTPRRPTTRPSSS